MKPFWRQNEREWLFLVHQGRWKGIGYDTGWRIRDAIRPVTEIDGSQHIIGRRFLFDTLFEETRKISVCYEYDVAQSRKENDSV